MRALILALALLAGGSAAAQTAPRPVCALRVAGLDFGTYRPLNAAAAIVSGELELRCLGREVSVPAVVRVSGGTSGQPIVRTMRHGNHELRYNLYTDSTHRLIAGDGRASTLALSPRRLRRGRTSFRLFARIPAGQRVPPGVYVDMLRIEVEF